MARADRSRPARRASAKRLALTRSSTPSGCMVGGLLAQSSFRLFVAISGSTGLASGFHSRSTHIRRSRGELPQDRLRRQLARRSHSRSALRWPCTPSVRPPGSAEADRASGRLFFLGRGFILCGALHHGSLDHDPPSHLPHGHDSCAPSATMRSCGHRFLMRLEPRASADCP